MLKKEDHVQSQGDDFRQMTFPDGLHLQVSKVSRFQYYNISLNIISYKDSHVNCKGELMTTYKNVTYTLEESLIKDIKQIALDEDKTQKEIVNKMLKDGVRRKKSQTRLDE